MKHAFLYPFVICMMLCLYTKAGSHGGNMAAYSFSPMLSRSFSCVILSADTPATPADTVKPKEKRLGISGTITVEGRYSEIEIPYQTMPLNYVRTHLQTQVTFMGVPVQTGITYSTENNATYRINSIRLNFNNEQFVQQLRADIQRKRIGDVNMKMKDSLSNQVLATDVNMEQLNKKISSPSYQADLVTSAEFVSQYQDDTLMKESFRYRQSKLTLDRHDSLMRDLSGLQQKKKLLQEKQRQLDMDVNLNQSQPVSDREMNTYIRQNKKANPLYSVAMNIRRLDLGIFSPSYNSLIVNGINMIGGNVEVNPGYAYAAVAYGLLYFPSRLITPQVGLDKVGSYTKERGTIFYGRAGVGKAKSLLFALNYFKADFDNAETFGRRGYSNVVIGADLTYEKGKNKVIVEAAKSYTNDLSSITYGVMRDDVLNKRNLGIYNFALSSAYEGVIKPARTSFRLDASYTAPAYKSSGSPFLRQDNLRFNIGTRTSVYKNIINLNVTLRNERDNLYKLRSASNTLWFSGVTATFTYKNYPYLSLNYSPGFQQTYDHITGASTTQRFSLYSIQSGYQHQGNVKLSLNLLMARNLFYYSSFTDSIINSSNTQYAFDAKIVLPMRVEILSSLSIIADNNSTMIIADNALLRLLGRSKAGAGFRYSKDLMKTTSRYYYLVGELHFLRAFTARITAGYNQTLGIVDRDGYRSDASGMQGVITITRTF